MDFNFFQIGPLPAHQMTGFFDPKLILLSYIVAVFASYTALDIAGALQRPLKLVNYWFWLLGGAIAMGTGIWTMHFVGMEAFITPVPMTYGFFLTFLSLIIAIFASGFSLYWVARPIVTFFSIIIGGILMGVGIASMHYVGMAAMQDVQIRYIPSLFFLSILIAIIASQAALWLMNKSNSSLILARFNVVSALVMGAAICGMHYTGMAAAIFTIDNSSLLFSHQKAASGFLPFYLATTISLLFILFLASSSYRKKALLSLQEINQQLEQKKSELSDLNKHLTYLAQDLVDKESRTRAILTTAPDGIITFDEKGKIELANSAVEKIFNYSSEEITQQNILDLIFDPNIPNNQLIEWLNDRDQPVVELVGKCKDGATFPCEIALSSLNQQNKLDYILVIRDITLRKEAERQLELVTQKLMQNLIHLERTQRAAEQASIAKSLFLANMSHEIRTPLNSIIGTASLLTRLNLDERGLKYANRIYTSSHILLDLINDILDFSKIESGELELDLAPVDFQLIVKEVIENIEIKAQEKNLTFLVYYVSQIPTTVITDCLRLKQILNNLISNAIKFTENGSVIVNIYIKQKLDNYLIIKVEVKDTGIGIGKENFNRLFQKFSQADSSTTKKFGGTGLGLAIVKQLVELFGGEIGFDSELGIGSTFWFEIPFLVDRETFAKEEKRINDLQFRLRNFNVLIISDSLHSQGLKTYLDNMQVSNSLVPDFSEASKMIADAKHPFDFLLIHYDQTQNEFLKNIKDIKKNADVFIFSSVPSPLELENEMIKGWLIEPIYPFDLYSLILASTK